MDEAEVDYVMAVVAARAPEIADTVVPARSSSR
jgi:hypothetical protein